MTDGQNRNDLIVRVMALLSLDGVGPSTVNRLVNKLGSLTRVVDYLTNPRSESVSARLASDPLIKRVQEAWAEGVSLDQYRDWLNEVTDLGGFVVIKDDPEFPDNLRDVATVPPLLYVKGTLSELTPRALSLVGTTEPGDRGRARAQKFARLCTQHRIQVVSGLARGIDGASHVAALESGAATYACLGHGFRFLYPPEHSDLAAEIAKHGALISQFPPDVPPSAWTFPARNELMCTLAKGTVIIEIEQGEKFGSVIQAKFSIKHGRPVFILRSNLTELHSPIAKEMIENDMAIEVGEFTDVLSILEKSNSLFARSTELPLSNEADQPAGRSVGDDPTQPAGPNAKAILFDMDGVFFDLLRVQPAAYAEAIRVVTGQQVDQSTLLADLHLSPYKVLSKYGAEWKAGNAAYNAEFSRLIGSSACLHDLVVSFMRRAHDRGFRIGIVTHQPRYRTDQIVRHAGLTDIVDVAITYNDIPKDKRKPHPYPLLRALEVLKVTPENAVYVGDTPNDVLAAREAGVFSVAVGWGLTTHEILRRWSPDMFVVEPAELDELLAEPSEAS